MDFGGARADDAHFFFINISQMTGVCARANEDARSLFTHMWESGLYDTMPHSNLCSLDDWDCDRNWKANSGYDDHVATGTTRALFGFDDTNANYCAQSYLHLRRHRHMIPNCLFSNLSVLRLHVNYTTCANIKWQLCAINNLLPRQRGIAFSFPPSALLMKDTSRGARLSKMMSRTQHRSYTSSDVFLFEVCLFSLVCKNDAELFSVRIGERFDCEFDKGRLKQVSDTKYRQRFLAKSQYSVKRRSYAPRVKYEKYTRCPEFKGSPFCGIEWDEWVMARALMEKSSKVIEFGARYGTTSCVLAEVTGQSGNVVSVEVDSSVYRALEANRKKNNCNFWIAKGLVSSKPMRITNVERRGFSTLTSVAEANVSLTIQHVQQYTGITFDTILFDCEGCIDTVFDPDDLKNINLILMEHDESSRIQGGGGYKKWFDTFTAHGFECIWRIRDTADRDASWSRRLIHSAWQRGGIRKNQWTCREYKKYMNYSDDHLMCLSTL